MHQFKLKEYLHFLPIFIKVKCFYFTLLQLYILELNDLFWGVIKIEMIWPSICLGIFSLIMKNQWRFSNKNIHKTCPKEYIVKFWKTLQKVLKFLKSIYLESLTNYCLHICISDSGFTYFSCRLYILFNPIIKSNH